MKKCFSYAFIDGHFSITMVFASTPGFSPIPDECLTFDDESEVKEIVEHLNRVKFPYLIEDDIIAIRASSITGEPFDVVRKRIKS